QADSVLFRKAVEHAIGANVQPPISDRRRAFASIPQVVDSNRLPLRAGLDDGGFSFLADGIDLPVGGNRRGVVFAGRALEPGLFDDRAGPYVQRSENPAFFQRV